MITYFTEIIAYGEEIIMRHRIAGTESQSELSHPLYI